MAALGASTGVKARGRDRVRSEGIRYSEHANRTLLTCGGGSRGQASSEVRGDQPSAGGSSGRGKQAVEAEEEQCLESLEGVRGGGGWGQTSGGPTGRSEGLRSEQATDRQAPIASAFCANTSISFRKACPTSKLYFMAYQLNPNNPKPI